jgi:hypothetical protein
MRMANIPWTCPQFTQQKGMQCQGMNAKKQSRCRNAALMEYIGTLYILCFSDNVKEGDSS